jgi:p-aminobenzoyl-glutamate transporter AbgT
MIDAERVEKSGGENMEGKCLFLEFILMLSYAALLVRSAQRTASWGIL